jgi:hypothetical protein
MEIMLHEPVRFISEDYPFQLYIKRDIPKISKCWILEYKVL